MVDQSLKMKLKAAMADRVNKGSAKVPGAENVADDLACLDLHELQILKGLVSRKFRAEGGRSHSGSLSNLDDSDSDGPDEVCCTNTADSSVTEETKVQSVGKILSIRDGSMLNSKHLTSSAQWDFRSIIEARRKLGLPLHISGEP